MPRGRPPKNRTREEAVNARREQVRKNVQAFRERRRQQQEPGNQTSLTEGVDPSKSDDQADDLSTHEERSSVHGHGHDASLGDSDHDSKAVAHSGANKQSLALWTRLPPELSHSQLSRLQFVSNCVASFKPESILNTGPHWTDTLPEIVNRDRTLDFSIQAICIMQLGNFTNQRWLLEEGSKSYGQALRTLTRRLPTDKDFREEVFMAMMALSIYELFQGTDVNGQGWLIHYKAAFRYLKQLSQAKNGWVPNNQPVFHFLETLCIFDALGSRKSNYFSTSDAWSQSLDHWGGTTYGPLLGLMTSVPILVEAHDALLNPNPPAKPSQPPSRSELLTQCFRLEARFQEWHHDTTSRLQNFTFTTTSAMLPGSEDENGTRLIFPTLFIARLHLLYWSALVLLLDTAASLVESMHSNSDLIGPDNYTGGPLSPSSSATLQDSQDKSHQYALWIRQSLRFCLDPENGVAGKSMVLLPLWVARNHFQQEAGNGMGEMERCNEILAALGQRDLNFGTDGVTDGEGDVLTGVHWKAGGLASFDRGRKELANFGAYCL